VKPFDGSGIISITTLDNDVMRYTATNCTHGPWVR
jgi:hypothetical protein